ncbi:MAG: metal-dependent transcriptional regulator [Actinomycetota bacterium]|nr:metal-dependent transcriptional regulator [Actinomycetota bacterium]
MTARIPPSLRELSETTQDYLREIHALEHDGRRATTLALAKKMRVAPPSVTSMLKKLSEVGLVDHTPYRGAVLTETGRTVALELLRHHRLLEQYLAETLAVPIDAVHSEADRLEHALSEELERRIDESLGFPTHDPHGDPIPSAQLVLEESRLRPLAALEPGERAIIRRVRDRGPEFVRYLAELGLLPGHAVEVLAAAPFDGPVTVRVVGKKHAIAREVAADIGVD